MATTKITITLPDRQLQEIRKRVADQDAPNRLRLHSAGRPEVLENAAKFRAMVQEALEETGGPLKPKERAWARRMLSPRSSQNKRCPSRRRQR